MTLLGTVPGEEGVPLLTPTPYDVPAIASLFTQEWAPEWETKHAASSVSGEADLDICSFTQATAGSLSKLDFFFLNLFIQNSAQAPTSQ